MPRPSPISVMSTTATTTNKENIPFYSNLGKKRLQRIWKEQNLDQEMVISQWIGVGPSRSLLNESVSDYMQNFLHLKNKRIVLINHALNSYHKSLENSEVFYESTITGEKYYDFQAIEGAYQAIYEAIMDIRMRARELEERSRVHNLIINHQMNPPIGFKNVFYDLNTLSTQISVLEKLELTKDHRMTFGDLPKIKAIKKSSKLYKKLRLTKKLPDSVALIMPEAKENHFPEVETLVVNPKVPKTYKAHVEHLTKINICPPPPLQVQIQLLMDYKLNEQEPIYGSFDDISSMWEIEDDNTRSYSSNIEDVEIFSEAQLHDFYGFSGEVEFTMDFPFMSALVQDVVQEKIVPVMFEKAHKTIRAYGRQLLTAKDEVTELNKLISLY